MTYAVIGAGNFGTALARLFSRAGIEISIANTRGPETIEPLVGSAVAVRGSSCRAIADAVLRPLEAGARFIGWRSSQPGPLRSEKCRVA